MATREPLPEPWRTALEAKGITSRRGLATKTGIAPQTALRLIDGIRRPRPETVAAVADSLFDGDRDKVWELAGYGHTDHGEWHLPPEASLLDQDQREAVIAVVRAMLPAAARHLTPVEDKTSRRDRTEPTVEQVRRAQLKAVANEGDPDDAAEVDEILRKARLEQTGRED